MKKISAKRVAKLKLTKRKRNGKRKSEASKQGASRIDPGLVGQNGALLGKGANESRSRNLHPDNLHMNLPSPPFTEEDKQEAAQVVFQHIWQQSVSGAFEAAA